MVQKSPLRDPKRHQSHYLQPTRCLFCSSYPKGSSSLEKNENSIETNKCISSPARSYAITSYYLKMKNDI